MEQEQPSIPSNKSPFIIIAAAVIVIVIGGVGYMVTSKKVQSPESQNREQQYAIDRDGDEVSEIEGGIDGDGLSDEQPSVPAGDTGAVSPVQSTQPSPEVPGIELSKPSEKTFEISGFNFGYTPSEIRVKRGDTVHIVFKNSGGFHDFVIDALSVRTERLGEGETADLTFVADKTGSFEYYCSVGKHREMGMKGVLIIE